MLNRRWRAFPNSVRFHRNQWTEKLWNASSRKFSLRLEVQLGFDGGCDRGPFGCGVTVVAEGRAAGDWGHGDDGDDGSDGGNGRAGRPGLHCGRFDGARERKAEARDKGKGQPARYESQQLLLHSEPPVPKQLVRVCSYVPGRRAEASRGAAQADRF